MEEVKERAASIVDNNGLLELIQVGDKITSIDRLNKLTDVEIIGIHDDVIIFKIYSEKMYINRNCIDLVNHGLFIQICKSYAFASESNRIDPIKSWKDTLRKYKYKSSLTGRYG